MASLHCVITTPEGLLFEGDVRSVVVPAADGELGILPRHAPLVGLLGHGELRLELAGGGKSRYFVDGGFVEVLANQVSVLATEAEGLESVDRGAAQAKVEALASNPPAKAATIEEREAHAEKLRAARRRVKLLG